MMSYLKNVSGRLLTPISFVVLAALLVFNAPAVYANEDPQALVKNTTVKMFSSLKKEKANIDKNPDLIYGLVSKIVLPHFDFISMSKWVLGKNWNAASRAQKIGFIKAYRELMVRTYSIALLEYVDSKISYKPLRDDISKGDVTVKTQVQAPDGKFVSVNYSLHKKKKGWKVYDIAVEGVSLIASNKTSYASEIRASGLDALIARLQKHNKGKES